MGKMGLPYSSWSLSILSAKTRGQTRQFLHISEELWRSWKVLPFTSSLNPFSPRARYTDSMWHWSESNFASSHWDDVTMQSAELDQCHVTGDGRLLSGWGPGVVVLITHALPMTCNQLSEAISLPVKSHALCARRRTSSWWQHGHACRHWHGIRERDTAHNVHTHTHKPAYSHTHTQTCVHTHTENLCTHAHTHTRVYVGTPNASLGHLLHQATGNLWNSQRLCQRRLDVYFPLSILKWGSFKNSHFRLLGSPPVKDLSLALCLKLSSQTSEQYTYVMRATKERERERERKPTHDTPLCAVQSLVIAILVLPLHLSSSKQGGST